MRKSFSLVVIGILALFVALGSLAPAATEAAPAVQFQFAGTIQGTLVATPQATLPATLLIQVNGRTIPVVVSNNTQVENSAGGAISLSSLTDGDTLRVTGRSGWVSQIDATLIQDLSQSGVTTPPPSYTYQVTGTLATEYSNVLCLQNTSITNAAITPNVVPAVTPCPSGDLAVYYTGGTSFVNANGTAIAVSSLVPGNSLTATGTLTNGQFTASLVQDLSLYNPTVVTPPATSQITTVTVVGTIQVVHFSGGKIYFTLRVTQGSMAGTYTIYVQSNLRILSRIGAAIRYSSLHTGQQVTVTGLYNKHTHSWSTTLKIQTH